MNHDRWQQIQEIFHDVADLPPADQRAAVEARAGGDEALVAAVQALLAADAGDAGLLDRGVADAAQGVLAPGAPPTLPTEPFGAYRVTGILGEGGMGVVYLAEREDLGSRAAVKILRDAWLSPARRERFAQEQRTLAQLHHPGIAQLYDAGTLADGTPWLVMEYVEGVSLTDHCRRHRVSLAEKLRLFRDVCEAVQYAHRHAIIHRDLKPSNILVTADGSVKLLDFGIAKQLEALETSADQTRTGLRLMTPAYAAPEQVTGGRIGTRTDVYSLGVTLYELLVGRLPFDLSDKTPAEAAAVLLQEEPERPSAAARREAARLGDPAMLPTAGKGAWADLDVLCLTAMHKEPERRYPSVEALIRDIDHFQAGEPLEARPDSVGYRLGKFVRRNRMPVVAAAAALVAIVGLTSVYTLRLAAARNEAVAEAARAQRIQRFMLALFEGGDATVGPADSLRVVELVARGIREAQGLATDPVAQAELFENLGGISQKLGRLAQADSLLTRALTQRRTLHGPAHPDVVSSLVALALLRLEEARVDSAEVLAREALAVGRSALSPSHPQLARATIALGRVMVEKGALDEAIGILEEGVRLHEAQDRETPELAEAISELANRHFYAGNYAASDSLNLRVLAIDRRLHGEQHPRVADDLINLGANQFQWARFDEAVRYYREGLAIMEGWYGPEHFRTGAALTMLGRAQLQQERYGESQTTLERALAIQERVFGAAHPRVASILNELGSLALRRGDHVAAEARYRRMAGIYETTYGPRHWLIALSRANLGGVFYERGEHREAERWFRDAAAHFAETQGAEHQNTAIVRIRLGRALLGQGRAEEAVTEVQAGYDLLLPQMAPGAPWLQRARTALAEASERLGRVEEAARWRAELADSGRSAAARRAGN